MSSLGSLGAECRAGAGDRGGAPGVAGRGRHIVPVGGLGGGHRRGRGAQSPVRPLRQSLRPGMVALALSSPSPSPGCCRGEVFIMIIYLIFFFLENHLVWWLRDLVKKKKKSCGCWRCRARMCVCVLVHLSWVAGEALGKFRLFFFFCNLLFRRVSLHPSPRGRPSRTRPRRPRPRGAPGTPRGPRLAGRSERGRGRPSPARAPAGGEGRAEWDSFRLVQPRRARSSQHFSSSCLWSLYSAERCC